MILATKNSHPSSNKNIEQNDFTILGLSEKIVKALIEHGYTVPTAVQMKTIPLVLQGSDLIVSSPTGSGKTAAFMLPAIQKLAEKNDIHQTISRSNRLTVAKPQLLVLTPTRELAVQVKDAAENYGKNLRRLRTTNILGGVSYHQQLLQLKQNPEIIVATPGRLIDFLQRRCINLSHLLMLVLDEADRMLDMGFIEDIEKIISYTPKEKQTLLFSATINKELASLTDRFMKNPLRISIQSDTQKKENIVQSILWADNSIHKDKLLSHLLNDTALDQAIVFTATKNNADILAARLNESGIKSAALHGNLPQHARNRTLGSLRSRRLRILVATDIAARGIDVPGITHVFNYDLPKFAEDYVHRIGRTGRAGRTGIAVSLVEHNEINAVKRIEKFIRQTLSVNIIQGLEPTLTAPTRNKSSRFNHKNQKSSRFLRPSGNINNQDRAHYASQRLNRFSDPKKNINNQDRAHYASQRLNRFSDPEKNINNQDRAHYASQRLNRFSDPKKNINNQDRAHYASQRPSNNKSYINNTKSQNFSDVLDIRKKNKY